MQDYDKTKENLIIVAIASSAYDVKALESFFNNIPETNHIAFVVIQHIKPSKRAVLPIFNGDSNFIVSLVEDGVTLRPNNVYIIESGTNVYLENQQLFINNNAQDKSTLNYFLLSLVKEQQDLAITVILSGEGIDGLSGLKSLKEAGGMVMAQEPESAKLNGMIAGTISAGVVDFVLPVEKLGGQLLNYLNKTYSVENNSFSTFDNSNLLDKIFILLRNKTGNDFSNYKKNTILRRVRRRMIINKIDDVNSYVKYLQQNSFEVETLFKELLIGVTAFFRDPEAFEVLKKKVIPYMLANKPINEPFRIWISGCSTGEEAYSIAMILKECMNDLKQTFTIQIFATDIDNEAIETARVGIYPKSIETDVSPERLNRFFIKKGHIYQVRKEIREMIIFALQNLVKDPPFSKLDIISCRNLLIYLESSLQKKILPLFHYRLNNEGILFLGTSESIGEFTELFSTVDRKWKVFRKRNTVSYSRAIVDFSLSTLSKSKNDIIEGMNIENKKFNIRELTERLLLERYSPSCVIINEKYEIIYFHGRTGKYLEPVMGEANLNILGMARQGIKKQMSTGIRRAISKKKEFVYHNLKVKVNDKFQKINLIIKPIMDIEPLNGLVMIIFEESIAPVEATAERDVYNAEKEQNTHVSELEHELNSTREYLQTTIEELETSNEELKSTNEELQSSNEELQSTNEELETSKEELQAVNEELITLNSELQLKIDELSEANNDMYNLLTSTNIGTIFLDTNLLIKRFTPSITKVFNLINSDIGRPITHISSNLIYENLAYDVENVLSTLISKEIDVQTKENKYYRMRIIPYRTTENVIDGTVVTFIDITNNKNIELQLNKLLVVVEQSPVMVMITDIKGRIEYVNSKFSLITGYSLDEIMGKNPNIFKSGETPTEVFSNLWETISEGREWSGEFRNRKKSGELYWEHCVIYPIKNKDKNITHFVAIKEALTERKNIKDEINKIIGKF